MEAITNRLAVSFAVLREQGLAKQTPIYFWYQNWEGNERSFSDIQVVTPKTRRIPQTLGVQERRKLVELLLACETMYRKESREAVLRELRHDIVGALLRDHQSTKLDITLIVNTCLNYSGGLYELIDAIRSFEGDSLQMQQLEEFLQAVPPGL